MVSWYNIHCPSKWEKQSKWTWHSTISSSDWHPQQALPACPISFLALLIPALTVFCILSLDLDHLLLLSIWNMAEMILKVLSREMLSFARFQTCRGLGVWMRSIDGLNAILIVIAATITIPSLKTCVPDPSSPTTCGICHLLCLLFLASSWQRH